MAQYGAVRTIEASAGNVGKYILTGIIAILLLVLISCSVTKVDTGAVAVLTQFGRVTGETLDEGIHLISPLKTANEMTIRTLEQKERATVPSSEGLIMTLDVSLLYHLDRNKATQVYQTIGRGYQITVVEPTMRAAIRETTASHPANALYTGEREQVAREIETALATELAKRGIVVEKILLRDIQLPEALKESIETKQQAEQESLAMQFRLQKERQEADRKRIEAQGIRDFQATVAQGITPGLLEWKGIEATEKLALSNNSKVVVVGNPKNGLPLILGGGER